MQSWGIVMFPLCISTCSSQWGNSGTVASASDKFRAQQMVLLLLLAHSHCLLLLRISSACQSIFLSKSIIDGIDLERKCVQILISFKVNQHRVEGEQLF